MDESATGEITMELEMQWDGNPNIVLDTCAVTSCPMKVLNAKLENVDRAAEIVAPSGRLGAHKRSSYQVEILEGMASRIIEDMSGDTLNVSISKHYTLYQSQLSALEIFCA